MWQRSADESLRVLDTIPQSSRIAYDEMIRNIVRFAQQMEKRGIPPEQVAASIERSTTRIRRRATSWARTRACGCWSRGFPRGCATGSSQPSPARR